MIDGPSPTQVLESFTNTIVPEAWNDGQTDLVLQSSLLRTSWDGRFVPAVGNPDLNGIQQTHLSSQFRDDGFNFNGYVQGTPLSTVSCELGPVNQASNGGYASFLSADEQHIFGSGLSNTHNDHYSLCPVFNLKGFGVSDTFLMNYPSSHGTLNDPLSTAGCAAAASFLDLATAGPSQQEPFPPSMAQVTFNTQFNNAFMPGPSNLKFFGNDASTPLTQTQGQLMATPTSQVQTFATTNTSRHSSPNRRSRPHSASARSQCQAMGPIQCAYAPCTRRFRRISDRIRHESSVHLNIQGTHLCPIAGCAKSQGAGYSRGDKVTEHLWKKHGDLGYTKVKAR